MVPRAYAKPALFCLFTAVLGLAAPSMASTMSPKQVLIESKIAEVTRPAAEQLYFDTVKGRDLMADVAMVIKKMPDQSTVVEASIVSYGRGADFRRIETENALMILPTIGSNGSINMRLEPTDIEKIYVNKAAAATPAATVLFGIIGSQYEGPGAKAASTPGKVCPVTGKPLTEGDAGSRRGDVSQAIDKAGMAAGMALLTSQAKGQLDGVKVRWELSPSVRLGNFDLKFDAYNKNAKRSETMNLSVAYDPTAYEKQTGPKLILYPRLFDASAGSGPIKAEQKITVTPQPSRKFQFLVQNNLRAQDGQADDWTMRNAHLEYSGDDYWGDFVHEWDDFDDEGYCHVCGHYEPEADEWNYDADGHYIGDTRPIPDKLTKIIIDPEKLEAIKQGPLSGEKLTFITDYPVTRALFRAEAYNKKTQQLQILLTPVILKPKDE